GASRGAAAAGTRVTATSTTGAAGTDADRGSTLTGHLAAGAALRWVARRAGHATKTERRRPQQRPPPHCSLPGLRHVPTVPRLTADRSPFAPCGRLSGWGDRG